MLFDVDRGELAAEFGEDGLVTLPASAFPASSAGCGGARLLGTVGVPVGTVMVREPDQGTGRLPLVRDVVEAGELEGAPAGVGEWPVIGWLLNAHLALDPRSGAVHAVDPDEETVRQLHADVSSLVYVAARFQRLLDGFSFGDDDEEAGFARLDREVGRVREETGGVDPLPFRDDETEWSVVGEEIAMGQRFTASSPAGRSLHG